MPGSPCPVPAGWGKCVADGKGSAELSRAWGVSPTSLCGGSGGEMPVPVQAGTQRLFLLHPGLFCNRTFDEYACWPDGLPGSFVNVSCPWYLPWASSGKSSPFPPVSRGWGWGRSQSRVHSAAFLPRPSPPLPPPRRSLGLLMGA